MSWAQITLSRLAISVWKERKDTRQRHHQAASVAHVSHHKLGPWAGHVFRTQGWPRPAKTSKKHSLFPPKGCRMA